MESIVSLIIGGASFGFSVLMYFNNNGRRANERITKLETKMDALHDIPSRVTKIETVAEHAHNRLDSLEMELKEAIKEVKELQMQIIQKLVSK